MQWETLTLKGSGINVRRHCLLGALLFVVLNIPLLPAQEAGPDGTSGGGESPLEELIPRFKGRAVVLDITARVIEQNQTVIWNEAHQKVTIPGRPVGLKLVWGQCGSGGAVYPLFSPLWAKAPGSPGANMDGCPQPGYPLPYLDAGNPHGIPRADLLFPPGLGLSG